MGRPPAGHRSVHAALSKAGGCRRLVERQGHLAGLSVTTRAPWEPRRGPGSCDPQPAGCGTDTASGCSTRVVGGTLDAKSLTGSGLRAGDQCVSPSGVEFIVSSMISSILACGIVGFGPRPGFWVRGRSRRLPIRAVAFILLWRWLVTVTDQPGSSTSPDSAPAGRRHYQRPSRGQRAALAVGLVVVIAAVVGVATYFVRSDSGADNAADGSSTTGAVSGSAESTASGTSEVNASATSSIGSLSPEPTAATEQTGGSASSEGQTSLAGNRVAPPGTSTAVVPEPAVAIPTVDGPPVAVGATPGFVAIAPNGRYAYIANRAAGVVTVLDLTIDKVISTIPIQAGPPQYIAFAPDGNHAYVSIYNDPKTINLVAVLDTRTTRVLQTIPVKQKPYALAVTPDQRFVYVPSHDAGAIDIIDIGTNTVVDSVDVLPNPHWVTFSPDGKLAYIANHESNAVSVLDTGSRTVVKTIDVGTSAHSVAVSPDGAQVAVVCFTSNDVYFIDTATNQVLGTVAVGTNPQDISYSPDGRYVYTANVESDTVSVIDTETRTVTATIPTDSPTSVAVSPNGSKAYITNLDPGTLTILNTA